MPVKLRLRCMKRVAKYGGMKPGTKIIEVMTLHQSSTAVVGISPILRSVQHMFPWCRLPALQMCWSSDLVCCAVSKTNRRHTTCFVFQSQPCFAGSANETIWEVQDDRCHGIESYSADMADAKVGRAPAALDFSADTGRDTDWALLERLCPPKWQFCCSKMAIKSIQTTIMLSL